MAKNHTFEVGEHVLHNARVWIIKDTGEHLITITRHGRTVEVLYTKIKRI